MLFYIKSIISIIKVLLLLIYPIRIHNNLVVLISIAEVQLIIRS